MLMLELFALLPSKSDYSFGFSVWQRCSSGKSSFRLGLLVLHSSNINSPGYSEHTALLLVFALSFLLH